MCEWCDVMDEKADKLKRLDAEARLALLNTPDLWPELQWDKLSSCL